MHFLSSISIINDIFQDGLTLLVTKMDEIDFESPGFEHLRLYQNMSNLYYKLLTLNYQKEFCHLYKCQPIHKYYFSVKHKNSRDQQYLFTCLCAWLIKDKCQMNLEITPEEYEDLDVTVNIIMEALQLLLEYDEDPKGVKHSKNSVRLPVARLKLGYGSEAILALNILADRALQLTYELESNKNVQTNLIFHDKLSNESNNVADETSNSITIGQPLVGGGLTTRPLGSYKIDDESLLFDDTITERVSSSKNELNTTSWQRSPTRFADWNKQVDRMSSSLKNASGKLINTGSKSQSWSKYKNDLRDTKQEIQNFLHKFKPVLEAIPSRINKQLDTISNRELVMQTNLAQRIGDYLKVWRQYSSLAARNEALQSQVDDKMNTFEKYKAEMQDISHSIEDRIRELNDGGKLKELESTIAGLEKENSEFDLKIGLLLTVYCRVHSSLVKDNMQESS